LPALAPISQQKNAPLLAKQDLAALVWEVFLTVMHLRVVMFATMATILLATVEKVLSWIYKN
jgi:hypothetical protein